jgi:hypothetical protein
VFILLQIVVCTLIADLARNEPARWYKFFNETVYFVTAGLGAKNPGPQNTSRPIIYGPAYNRGPWGSFYKLLAIKPHRPPEIVGNIPAKFTKKAGSKFLHTILGAADGCFPFAVG